LLFFLIFIFIKAGIFDCFSDDHRLCIQKIFFDSKSGTFAVGGQAGQLMVFETLWKRVINFLKLYNTN
jgi:hypothetical protein